MRATDSIVRRHMKRTGRFITFEEAQTAPVAMPAEERIIGWYKNPPPWENELVLFTWSAIWISDGFRLVRLPIDELAGYQEPTSKADLVGVSVRMRGGDTHFVRVGGTRDGNVKDAFDFIMALRGLIGTELSDKS